MPPFQFVASLILKEKIISRIKDIESFIAKSRAKFGLQFSYEEATWHSARTPITLYCQNHKPAEKVLVTPDMHLRKKGGCRRCKADNARARHGKTRESFIAEARAQHGNAYGYDLLVYVNAKTRVLIYCHEHHVQFEQLPEVHLAGGGCPSCRSAKVKKSNAALYVKRSVNFEQFLARARAKHGDYYQYVPESYVSFGENIQIICPKHKAFSQRAERHTNGSECRKCVAENLKITEPALRSRIQQKFGSSLSVQLGHWSGFKTIAQAYCARHNHKWSVSAQALLNGNGCRHCVNEQKKQPELESLVSSLPYELRYLENTRNPEFLKFAIAAAQKHHRKYSYHENLFISFSRPCHVVCPIHNNFKLKPQEHLNGVGCPFCAYQENFIESARQRFGSRFDYTETRFSRADAKEKVSIRCVKHNVFGIISAEVHLRGTPFCRTCKLESRALTTTRKRLTNQTALLEAFRRQAVDAHAGKYEYPKLEEELVTRVSKITVYCRLHDFTFTPSAAAHVQTGRRSPSGCQRCKGDVSRLRYRKSYTEVEAKLTKHGFTLLTPEHEYKNQGEPMLVRCSEGHEVDVVPQKIFSGRSCPNCSPYVGEAITRSILEEGFGFSLQKRKLKKKDYPELIGPYSSLELDGYNPKHKTAFEYQGAWHSQRSRHQTELSYQDQLQRDEQKVVMCKELAIKLVIVNEFKYPFEATDVRTKIEDALIKSGLVEQCILKEPLLLLSHIPMLNVNGHKKLITLASEHNLTVIETAWHGKWHNYSWQCISCKHSFKAPYAVREAAIWKCCPACARSQPAIVEKRKKTMKLKDSTYLETLRERAIKLDLELLDTEWRTAKQTVFYNFKCIHTQATVKPRNYNSIFLGYSGCDCKVHRRRKS